MVAVSDEALYERLLGGELGAFDELYQRHERPLFGYILRHLRDRTEAEDVLHEAFLALIRERPRAQSFRAVLFTVARNLCLNRHRSRRRSAAALHEASAQGEPGAAPPDEALLAAEASRSLERAVAGLPSGLAEVYHLRASGLSYEELAQILSIPLGTVKSRMNEMVKRLREEMQS